MSSITRAFANGFYGARAKMFPVCNDLSDAKSLMSVPRPTCSIFIVRFKKTTAHNPRSLCLVHKLQIHAKVQIQVDLN